VIFKTQSQHHLRSDDAPAENSVLLASGVHAAGKMQVHPCV
jgi:hypothetical protein